MSDIFILVYLGLFGLAIGSFANAAVWRIHKHKDIVKERSECVHCHHKLGVFDLIPVFSWILLRGRCRYCKKPISPQYPLVELAVAAYFVLSFIFWPTPLEQWHQIAQFGLWLSFGLGLAILFVYDLRWYLLPDRVVYPLIVLGLAAAIIRVVATPDATIIGGILDIAWSLLPIAGFYGLLYYVSGGKWVGFGDVKLGVFMGLALGWQLALVTLMLANVLGFFVILPALLTKKITRTSRVPFGPFLISAFIISGLFGAGFLSWYLAPFLI